MKILYAQFFLKLTDLRNRDLEKLTASYVVKHVNCHDRAHRGHLADNSSEPDESVLYRHTLLSINIVNICVNPGFVFLSLCKVPRIAELAFFKVYFDED